MIGAAYVYWGTFDQLTDSVVFAAWIFYLLTVAACFGLRRRNAQVAEIFRAPGHPVLPLFFVIFAAGFILYSLGDSIHKAAGYFQGLEGSEDGVYLLISAGLILLGVPLYWIVRRTQPRSPRAFTE